MRSIASLRFLFTYLNRNTALVTLTLLIYPVSFSGKQEQTSELSYVVSMENPDNHYFHVSLTCRGLGSTITDFKLPSWTPGYYMIMDYAKNVTGFKAVDASGKNLKWIKTSKNTWRVNSSKNDIVKISYDVYSFRNSVADSYLDDRRGFISPTGIYMYVDGMLDHPVTVTVIPSEGFANISTGLDKVAGVANTFFASDFDVLYDCPVLAGSYEVINFGVDNIPYTIAAEKLGDIIDRNKLVDDYKKMIRSATSIIGEVPYKHYTFLIMNRGGGGLEHTNSQAVFSNPGSFTDQTSLKGWMSFTAHEFFHLYNVKTIRPIALGPFDYERENYTTMLWFSEGVTSYYENIILNRAGILSRKEVLDEMTRSIANYENVPGHLFQSASESSFDAWIYFLNRSENAENTTISYYDKGCALGMLLDLKIRYESDGKKSLDDVMIKLYRDYYKEKNRGFTDEEFRKVCEETAGCQLLDFFESYVPTVQEIDYAKYLGFAGLSIDLTNTEMPGSFFGASVRESGDNIITTRVVMNSSAYKAGLSAQDIITEIDSKKSSVVMLNQVLNEKKAGDTITLKVIRREMSKIIRIRLDKKLVKSYAIKPVLNPTASQKSLLDSWLR